MDSRANLRTHCMSSAVATAVSATDAHTGRHNSCDYPAGCDLRVCVTRLRHWFQHAVHGCCGFVARSLGPLWSRRRESGVLVMV